MKNNETYYHYLTSKPNRPAHTSSTRFLFSFSIKHFSCNNFLLSISMSHSVALSWLSNWYSVKELSLCSAWNWSMDWTANESASTEIMAHVVFEDMSTTMKQSKGGYVRRQFGHGERPQHSIWGKPRKLNGESCALCNERINHRRPIAVM